MTVDETRPHPAPGRLAAAFFTASRMVRFLANSD